MYVYPTIPDVDVCASYYRMTDKEALKAILLRGSCGGEIDKSRIDPELHQLYERSGDMAIYKTPGNGTAFRRLLRDVAWSLSSWNNKKLKKWLEREKPDCIFLAPGYAKFIYNIAMKVAKICHIPIVTYICDDYYFVKTPKGLVGKLQLWLLQRKMDQLMKKTDHIVTISEEMRENYTRHFGVPGITVMTGTNYEIAKTTADRPEPKSISYFGNLNGNRHISLSEIGKALETVNQELGTDYLLNIYTAEKKEEVLKVFDGIGTVRLRGFVTGAAFDQSLHSADILLHTEAFDEVSADLVKNSVSTKIADSLATGILLVAYGPDSISSVKHLIRNDCALVASSKDQLKQILVTAFTDAAERERITANALRTAKRYHCAQKNSTLLKQTLEGIVGDNNE